MIKSRVSLLLLWSLWSTASTGLESAALNRYFLNSGNEKNGEKELAASKWAMEKSKEDSEARDLRNPRNAPKLPFPAFKVSGDEQPENDQDKDLISGCEKKPECSPALARFSSSVSNGAAVQASSSVAASMSSSFVSVSASLRTLVDAQATGATQTPPGAPITVIQTVTAPAQTTNAATTSISATSETAVPAATTGGADATASIQESLSKAIEDAKASAASSAKSVIDAANARASPATATASSAPIVTSTQGSNLTPGQTAGIIISIAFVSSLLSALCTYLLMRRRERRQEPRGKLESDSPPDSRSQPPANEPYGLPEGFSPARGYTGPEAIGLDGASAFIPDVKKSAQPPPDAEHPAMSHAARPLSMPGPEGLDPAFPVSPLSSAGDETSGSGRLPSPVLIEPDPGETSGALPPMHNSNNNDGLRPQVGRLGSRDGPDGGLLSPLAMHPPLAEPGSQYRYVGPGDVMGYATEPDYAVPANTGRSPPPRVLSPTAKRPHIDPSSLERGPDY